MGKPSDDQRRALGAFLASKRARLKPAELGLVEGVRRTPGLRREEVAALSGVSASWYTWIEQGRDIQVSAETLRTIARTLRLDNVESAHIFALSQQTSSILAIDEQVSVGLISLVQALDPVPAYVRNKRFDILAWNKSIKELFIDYDALQPHERNTIRLMFLYPPYRTLILNWAILAQEYVSSLRAERTRAVNKVPFDALIMELIEGSEDFSKLWNQLEVSRFGEGCKRMRHPTLGMVTYTYLAMVPEAQPDLAIVTYLIQPKEGNLES